jgi:hypothetical protein
MIEEVKKYKTTDGKLHDKLCDAAVYQNMLNEADRLQDCKYNEFIELLDIGYQIKREDLINKLKDNSALLKAFANSI